MDEQNLGSRTQRRVRSDGERSRTAILQVAARLATVDGINGLSIGRLADAVGMSKSGVIAHFGSKEGLQLATVDAANDLFVKHVIAPGSAGATGLDRLRLLGEHFLQHVERRVFPGGCFFASVTAEMDTQAGPVRDRVVEVENDFFERLATAVRDAQAEGALDPAEDAVQLSFELAAYMFLANAQWVVAQDGAPIDRARHAIERRIGAATTPSATPAPRAAAGTRRRSTQRTV
jgi:AcrR family transcriptional regulator